MTNRRSIVVSGDLGSGKTTVSTRLAELLGLRRVSMGDVYRSIAHTRGMSALQLSLHAEHDVTVDDRVDQVQAEMARSPEQLVVDSRLGWYFFTTAFKVHLIVDPVVGAGRVLSRPASEVESYATITEAVERLQRRSESERIRFLTRYGVDKTRLRNYDMVCDTSRASPHEITADIAAAFDGEFGSGILQRSPPLVLLDPARILPSRPVPDRAALLDPAFAAGVGDAGRRALEPISIGYASGCFFVIDGHRRLSAALQNAFPLISSRLTAEGAEFVVPGLSAQEYFEAEVSLGMVQDWEALHHIRLPVPPHLASLVGNGPPE